MLIAGRTIQGIGGGGILAMVEIVVADLVPLRQRGTYMGSIGAVWAIASAVGPPVGGAFSQRNWRWLFYMNLPLAAAALLLVWCFLHLKVPQDDLRSKMRRMDWIGNLLVIAGTTLSVIALTWAGAKHPWSSYQVLVPLIRQGVKGVAEKEAARYEWTIFAFDFSQPFRRCENRVFIFANVFALCSIERNLS